MNYIELNNGVQIPQLGLGVFKTPAGETTENAVKWALQDGYRHIDTAMIYRNEESVGKGIAESGVAREDIFLTSKLWNDDVRSGQVIQAYEDSLTRLNTDYLDLYLIHWPAEGFSEAWRDMETLYLSGRVRAIGVSNFQQHHLDTLMETAIVVPAVNQIESHPYLSNQPLIDFCAQAGITPEVWSPLGGTGGHLLDDLVLAEIALKYEKTPAQIVLRWDIQREVIVIPKSVHQGRIASNLDVFDFTLSDEDMKRIDQLNKDERVGADPDNFNF